jgi:hypothetical protein
MQACIPRNVSLDAGGGGEEEGEQGEGEGEGVAYVGYPL